MEMNAQRGSYVPRCAGGVELTFHGVSLFSREPRVDYPAFNAAVT
jgi:hypothetical protein